MSLSNTWHFSSFLRTQYYSRNSSFFWFQVSFCQFLNINNEINLNDILRIFARATVELKQGDILYTSYTHTLNGTHARQSHLKLSKFFTCQCARCLDPTELGTNLSTLLCQCGLGSIMSINPIGL